LIPITYLPDNPAISRIDLPQEAFMYKWFPVALIFVGGLFTAGLIAMFKGPKPAILRV
jgi:hypothetical protein